MKPFLRPLDFQPIYFQGQSMWLLRDPLRLTDFQLIFPPALAQMLIFCDGEHDPEQIRLAFGRHVGLEIQRDLVEDTIAQLDAACLLVNDRSEQAMRSHLGEFRAQPHRPPALAGPAYPVDPDELATLFAGFSNGDEPEKWGEWHGRGLISPHIDYHRGGRVYARVWQHAAQAVAAAELALIFGTDHNGGPGTLTLTRLPYATPFGVLPAAPEVVEAVASAFGPEVFANELHHREEHSVELSAVWLHYARRAMGLPSLPMVPILCGSFHHFVSNGHRPAGDARLNAVIEALQVATAGRKVLTVASVDLAHVGPNFGDDFAMDRPRRAALAQSDGRVIDHILQGDAEGFYQEIAAVGDRHRVCGLSSIYLMLRYLNGTQGVKVAYEHCAADAQNTSLVSICGLLLE